MKYDKNYVILISVVPPFKVELIVRLKMAQLSLYLINNIKNIVVNPACHSFLNGRSLQITTVHLSSIIKAFSSKNEFFDVLGLSCCIECMFQGCSVVSNVCFRVVLLYRMYVSGLSCVSNVCFTVVLLYRL